MQCTPECPQPEVEEYDYAYADSAPPSREPKKSIDKVINIYCSILIIFLKYKIEIWFINSSA